MAAVGPVVSYFRKKNTHIPKALTTKNPSASGGA
jgi:hypothetical protein